MTSFVSVLPSTAHQSLRSSQCIIMVRSLLSNFHTLINFRPSLKFLFPEYDNVACTTCTSYKHVHVHACAYTACTPIHVHVHVIDQEFMSHLREYKTILV